MSTLHSDAPEFVPGKPFVLRSLISDVPECIPAATQGEMSLKFREIMFRLCEKCLILSREIVFG